MNWDDRTEATSKAIMVAAISDAMRRLDALNTMVEQVLPGVYNRYERRDGWSCQIRWPEHGFAVRLIPPPNTYFGFSPEDLVKIKERLHADRVYVDREGQITVHYDEGESHEQRNRKVIVQSHR